MKKVYRKLHLWLSVPFGVFITLICFSGAMLVFEKEITEMCRRDLYFAEEVREAPLPIDEVMTSVVATLPDSVSVTGLTISSDPARNWQIGLSKPRRAALYVDPYTGEIKGRSERLPFYDTMFHLHRWMMGSSSGFGKTLVGFSTLMLVVILVTGLLMWLTNRNKPLAKSLKICFTKGWPRFWHDLHVAGGIYATVFLLALALTGLTWSFSWYRTGFYKAFGVETSAGGGHGAQRSAAAGEGQREPRAERADRADRTERTEQAERAGRGGRADAADPAAGRSRRNGEERRGRITATQPYAEQERSAKVRSGVYTVHVGSWGGLATRILTFLAALLGATLPLTGYYLWIRRLIKGHPHHKK